MLDASVKCSGRQVHTTATAGQAAAQAINSRDVLCAWDAIIAEAPIDSTITLYRIVLQSWIGTTMRPHLLLLLLLLILLLLIIIIILTHNPTANGVFSMTGRPMAAQ